MTHSHLPVYPVLLAGGSGTRLWPVSRELYPKQLVRFIGSDSLIQSTIKRLSPVLDCSRVRIVCGREHSLEISRHMKSIGIQRQWERDQRALRTQYGSGHSSGAL